MTRYDRLTPDLPAKEDVAAAIFDVLRREASGYNAYLMSQIGATLNMGYDRLTPDYLLAVVRWVEARYMAGAVEPILDRLDRMEGSLDRMSVQLATAVSWIGGARVGAGPDDDDDEPQPAPHLDYDGEPL